MYMMISIAAATVVAILVAAWVIRSVAIRRNRSRYSVKELPAFLSPEECDHIIRLAGPLIDRSPVSRAGRNRSSLLRMSGSAFFTDSRDAVVRRVKRRVAEVSGTELRCQEPLQVTHYDPAGFYASHRDALGSGGPSVDSVGDRDGTMIIYLNDDFEGGHTRFPKIGVRIKPERGKAVFFKNLTEDGEAPDPLSTHLATPVSSGEKWLLNQWIRQHPIPTANRSERRAKAKGHRHTSP